MEGIPGEKYFQNYSDYKIVVRFDPASGKLQADALITYHNNSGDTLHHVVFRLYQNIAKIGGIRDEEIPEQDIHSGVRISRLKINAVNISERLTERTVSSGSNMIVYLNEPLVPAQSVNFEVRWSFPMPSGHLHRYGKYEGNNYFIAFWYPQIAVYDDIDGWDIKNYTGTQEFYNDFSNFDVKIQVPENFIVWATGELQNASDIFSSAVIARIENARKADDLVHVISGNDIAERNYTLNQGAMKYHFIADNITDFAFAVSDSYLWDAGSVIVDSISEKRVTVNAVYANQSPYYDSVVSIGKQVIRNLSFNSYGIAYPFTQVTVFNGDGGMEYPMIVNNGTTASYDATVFLTLHEIAHAYLPFLTGINERVYSWMDEGLTTYLPMETQKAINSLYYPLEHVINNYDRFAGTLNDVPLYVSAEQTRGFGYQGFSYTRACTAFSMLEQFMGRDDFRDAIREFILVWQYKHPTGNDLFAILRAHSNKDIDWFIGKWFYGFGYADQGIGQVSIEGDRISLEIVNKGNMPAPILLNFVYEDGNSAREEIPADIWQKTNRFVFIGTTSGNLKSIELGSPVMPDKYRADNRYSFN